jgi:hypothetical protein
MSNDPRRKSAHEQLLEFLRKQADAALDYFPEAESVTVVVSWKGHLRELPAGVVLTEGGVMTPDRLRNVAEQCLRMAGFAINRMQQVLAKEEKGATRAQDPDPGPAG